MTVYSSTLAPVRRLSIDILHTVFREVQRSQWKDYPEYTSETLAFSQGPWTLSHVCAAWRDVVLSYSRLWSHIVLYFSSPLSARNPLTEVYSAPHHILLAVKAMILRSEQCPLDIVFELDFDPGDEDMAKKVFAIILETSYRWRTVVLRISLDFFKRLKVVRGSIPCLESLALYASDSISRNGAARRYPNSLR
ncbi:hypothetical protein F5146DRAFT_520927 [Armillaria mellea]|nr:hypothetical protein F5146DRAFT_520927 [Armillaria mellea]